MESFGINGFGRIGRTATRAWWQKHRDKTSLKMINTSGSMELEEWAHLLKYDTNYGQFPGEIKTNRFQSKEDATDENPVLGEIRLSDDKGSVTIVVTAQRDPAKLPWAANGVDVVLDATGVFKTKEKASAHLEGGAKYVLISAPAKDDQVSSSIIGINDFDKDSKILSNESCTTNCVAPVTKIIEENFGIEKALLTTVHGYTDSQNLQDNSHKDMRRSRAAAENIIPTTTGAAKATTRIIPELENKFDGMAIRVPVPLGSLSDLVYVLKRDTTMEEVNQVLKDAAKDKRWAGVYTVTEEPIVSSDIVGRDESSIVDLDFTKVIGGNLVKILSWYDNEWSYCLRLIEQIERIK